MYASLYNTVSFTFYIVNHFKEEKKMKRYIRMNAAVIGNEASLPKVWSLQDADDIRSAWTYFDNNTDIKTLYYANGGAYILGFARNSSTPSDVLDDMFYKTIEYHNEYDDWWDILGQIVVHPNFDYMSHEDEILDCCQDLRGWSLAKAIVHDSDSLSYDQIKALLDFDYDKFPYVAVAAVTNQHTPDKLVKELYDSADEGSKLWTLAGQRLGLVRKNYRKPKSEGVTITVSNVVNYLISQKSKDSNVTDAELKKLAQLIAKVLKQEESENGEKYQSWDDANIEGLIASSDADDPIYQIGSRLLFGEM